MGGWGSGSRYGSKDTTDGYRKLDVRYLQREGCLERRYSFGLNWTCKGQPRGDIRIFPDADRVTLSYRHCTNGGEWESKEYPVFLEWTPCNYGGQRAWFRCPARGCGRRVAILYGGAIFACRQCHTLAYESQHEGRGARADSRAWAIRKRCGDWGGLFDPLMRPKGMHQRTFRKLKTEYRRATYVSAVAFSSKIGMSVKTMLAMYSD